MTDLSLVRADRHDQTSLFEQLLAVWLDGKTAKTKAAYMKDIIAYSRHAGLPPTQAVEQLLTNGTARACLDVASWMNEMKAEKRLSNSTCNRRLAVLKSIANTARDYGISDVEIPVRRLPARPTRDSRGPEPAAVSHAMHKLERDRSGRGMMGYAVARLCHDCALRRSEVRSIRLSDLDQQTGALQLVGKGARKEVVTIPEPTLRSLQAYITQVRGTSPGWLFSGRDGVNPISESTIYRLVRKNCDCRPHGLRHSGISTAARVAQRDGFGLQDLQSYSRHRDVTGLLPYLDEDRSAQARLAALVAESTE